MLLRLYAKKKLIIKDVLLFKNIQFHPVLCLAILIFKTMFKRTKKMRQQHIAIAQSVENYDF